MTKFIVAILFALTTAAHADADADAIARARKWLTAMHDHHAADAAAACATRLTLDDKDLATTDAITQAFAAEFKIRESAFWGKQWAMSHASFQVVSARHVAATPLPALVLDRIKKLTGEHRFVEITLNYPTTPVSRDVRTFVVAEQVTSSGTTIDVIGEGALMRVN